MNSAFLYSNSSEYGASTSTGLRSLLAGAIKLHRLGKIPNTIARAGWNVEEKEVRVYEAIVCRITECLRVGRRFTFKSLICFSLITVSASGVFIMTNVLYEFVGDGENWACFKVKSRNK
jgi:hypothetical protein